MTSAFDLEKRFARRMKRISEIGILNLGQHQIWPPRQMMGPEHVLPPKNPIVSKKTPIASMGSCFARAIKDHLQASGYNYLQCGAGDELQHGSALWERVYSTPCIRQEIERGFGLFTPDLMSFDDGRTIDPYRKHRGKGRVFATHAAAASNCEAAAIAAREALTQAKVFILTLGLSEVWYDKETGKTFSEPLPAELFNPDRHSFKLLSPAENATNIGAALDLLHHENPEVKVVLTVSPIPLRATFMDRSVVVSNTVSKASLIWAAHEMVAARCWVDYFPSYEIVTALLADPYDWDLRHVTDEAAAHIMEMFEATFVA